MSWGLEIAVLPAIDQLTLDFYVPDVFGPTGNIRTFEEATSVAIVPNMCAGRVGDRVVVIDVGCRIVSAGANFFESIDASIESGLFYRITSHPVELVIADGAQVLRTRGFSELLALLGGPQDVSDAEEAAIAALKARTGLDFPRDFWFEYDEFGPD